MAKSAGQKLKLLYIVKMLEELSDENHPLSTADIIAKLEAQDIHSERKSIYDDMQKLTDFGYDIVQVHSRQGGGYYLGSRAYELAELKMLVDAVQSSRFITTKKSRELIQKLERMAGKYDAGKLQRQVYVAGRNKTENEGIYYSVDTIHNAIQENRQISFVYLDWTVNKELKPRSVEKRLVSPWALVWRDENYYLLAYDEDDRIMKHFRVDKMGDVTVTARNRVGRELFDSFDMAKYANQTFGMFGGKQEVITLQCPVKLVGVVLDRFGKDISIRDMNDGTIRARVNVVVSGQFFGWLSGIGKEIQIAAPESVKEQYGQWLSDILKTL